MLVRNGVLLVATGGNRERGKYYQKNLHHCTIFHHMLAYLFYFPQWWSMKEVQPIISLSNMNSFWKVGLIHCLNTQHHCTHDLFSRTFLKLKTRREEKTPNYYHVQNITVKQKYFLSPFFHVECCSCVVGIIWWIIYCITLLNLFLEWTLFCF